MKKPVKEELVELTNHAVRVTGTASKNKKGQYSIDGDLVIRAPFKDAEFLNVTQTVAATNAHLTSLEGFPRTVGGNCLLGSNNLSSLQGAPLSVGMMFSCRDNQISSLEGMPQKVNIVNVSGNPLKNLVGLSKKVITLTAIEVEFESLEGLENVEMVKLDWQPRLGLLRLLVAIQIQLLPGNHGTHEEVEAVQNILNKYAGQGRQGSLACAAELSRAGFKGNARW
jgi:hypothetical protein